MKVSTNGVVTATYKYFKGTFDAQQKPQYATCSCATVMLPTTAEPPPEGEGAEPLQPDEWFEGAVQVFFPPVAATGFPGYAGRVLYPFAPRDVQVPSQD
jgi:hypothetical protein